MKRRVAKLVGPKRFEVFEEPIPAIEEDEVLLRILSCGLCQSDMPTYHGESDMVVAEDGSYIVKPNVDYPVELGHEPVAIVEDVGKSVNGFKPGDYVGGMMGGCFASHIVCDTSLLVRLPDGIKEPKYCLTEPLSCISNIVRAANPEFGDYVAVVGCGMMGLMCVAGLSRSSAREVIGIDLVDSRLEWAKKMGATKTINPRTTDVVAEVNEITNGSGVDVVIEITGRLAGLGLACDIVRNASYLGYQGRGKILMPSLYAGRQTMDESTGYQLMLKSPILHSTHPWYSHDLLEDAGRGVWGYANGLIPLDKIITHEFSLDDIDRGFKIAEAGTDNYIKGIVVP